MKVVAAQFVTSATGADDVPHDGVPHVALIGRSNVGKSTLINALAKRTIARTSAAPGKTRLANLYRLEVEGGPGGPGRWRVCLADLPGYGYARGGQASVVELRTIAEAYFGAGLALRQAGAARADVAQADVARTDVARTDVARTDVAQAFRPARPAFRIAGVLHLIDARHPELDSDADAARWLQATGVERTVIATKVDKLSRKERTTNLRELERQLGTAALPISAANGEGLDDLWTLIARLIRER